MTGQLAATDIRSCYALSIIPFWPRLESVGLLCRALVAWVSEHRWSQETDPVANLPPPTASSVNHLSHTHTHNMSGSNRTSTADNCPQINRELKQQEFGRVCKMSIEYSSSQHDSPLQKLTCHMCVCKYVISMSGLTSTNFNQQISGNSKVLTLMPSADCSEIIHWHYH